ncbi:class I SAM-dependent methyltransferase [Thauera sp.]|jgi:SAM-dependent methyltransferase
MPSNPSLQPRLHSSPHASGGTPSEWVRRFADLLPSGARVLDLAAGGGRHARLLAGRGFRVTAVDRDAAALATMEGVAGIETRVLDLENACWPLDGECFDAVVVANYLYRPRLAELFALVRPGGLVIYETFMLGNERFGKPSNPDFLLRPGELISCLPAGWCVIAFEQGEVERPAMIQRLCATRSAEPGRLPRPV